MTDLVTNVDTGALLTLTDSAAGTFHSTDQLNNCGSGLNGIIDLTKATSASVVVSIEGKDVASGKYYTILSSAALTTISTTLFSIFPEAAAGGGWSLVRALLPRTWRVTVVITGGSADVSGTIGASVIE